MWAKLCSTPPPPTCVSLLLLLQVFATQFEEDEREKGKRAAEEKEFEDVQRYKEAFERIRKIVGPDSTLDKIVGDFIKVEDQNFALFNYVTEMNNQVRAKKQSKIRDA